MSHKNDEIYCIKNQQAYYKKQLLIGTFRITCMDSFPDFIVFFQFEILKDFTFLMQSGTLSQILGDKKHSK